MFYPALVLPLTQALYEPGALGFCGRQNSKITPKIVCTLVYTHLLPVIQLDMNLGSTVKGFCRSKVSILKMFVGLGDYN